MLSKLLRNFHCGAMIPVVKLFWWVALEPTTRAKCKPAQSQWVLLKLESCSDVIKRLFSTAIKAGQHNVPAQEVFLEKNGCNEGGCSACDVITLSQPYQPVGVNQRHRYRRERFWVQFLGRSPDSQLCPSPLTKSWMRHCIYQKRSAPAMNRIPHEGSVTSTRYR